MSRNSIELFSDYFAQANNALTQIDARVKLIFSLAHLILILASDRINVMLLIAASSILSLFIVKIPFKLVLARLVGPAFMVAVLIILQGFFFGSSPLFSFDLGWFNASIYYEGVNRGLLIGARVIAGVSVMVFLSMTTPINKLLGALRFFKVPNGWLEILAFTYRYIFVFIEEAQNIMDAQRLRLGYNGLAVSLRSWGTLAGSLFTRVYDQANATHNAMVLRGYSGSFYVKKPGNLTAYDITVGAFLATVLTVFTFLTL